MKNTLINLLWILFCGCASTHAEPLPPVRTNAVVTFTPSGAVIAGNRAWYLTNSAPDFALGMKSVNWTKLPAQPPTTALDCSVPPGSLITVSELGTNGVESISPETVLFVNYAPTGIKIK